MDNYQLLLKKYWGYDSFRGIQQEIIESIGAGHDTLGLMPTGGGKSITFQVPALAKEGVCIVITPLIALMKDQVFHLRQRHIRAEAIYSGLSHDDVLRILENAVFGAVKLLYISPERLSSELFQQKLRHMKVSFICVDEAHCICQWGYDFRPSYLEIAKIRKIQPDCPVLALTATATPAVVQDIQDKLSIGHPFQVFKMSFRRSNLAYIVRNAPDKEEELLHILNQIAGSAIIYVRSRQRTREVAELLQKAGISATYFHAGLEIADKDMRQRLWRGDQIRVMVATNAFGMGIDKPDVRLVIHMDCPDSIEAYFQEAGRAGRDGQKAYAILLHHQHDLKRLSARIADTWPEKDYIRQVYDHLAYFYQIAVGSGYNAIFEFPIDKFCFAFKHFPIRLESALKILTRAGYIRYTEEEESKARVKFTLERDELYQLRGNSPQEDALIETMLRYYSGLFTDYQYVDESFLAQQTQSTIPQVYLSLKQLSQRHILHFIPQKKTPYIYYTQRREDSEHLVFPPAIYDDLKQRYTERVNAMIAYVSNNNICRSRQLLHYFGEEGTSDCGQCDVCMSQKSPSNVDVNMAKRELLQLVQEKQPCHISALHTTTLPYELMEEALQRLIEEEVIINDDGYLSL